MAGIALGGLVGALVALYNLDDVFNRGALAKNLGAKAAQALLDARGIPLDLEGEVNQKTITEAINVGVLGDGVRFTNLFDRDAVRADVKRLAIEKATELYGLPHGSTLAQIREGVEAAVLADVKAEIEAGAGDYVNAAKDLPEVMRYLAVPSKGLPVPVDMSAAGISNRERQATYRANHKRVWVER